MQVTCSLRRGLRFGGMQSSAPQCRNDTILLAPLIHQKLTVSLPGSQLASGGLWLLLPKRVYGTEQAAPVRSQYPHFSLRRCSAPDSIRQAKEVLETCSGPLMHAVWCLHVAPEPPAVPAIAPWATSSFLEHVPCLPCGWNPLRLFLSLGCCEN